MTIVAGAARVTVPGDLSVVRIRVRLVVFMAADAGEFRIAG